MRHMRNSKGFLLLEVMVSIVVITGGLIFIMRVFSASKSMIDRSREMFFAGLLLEEKMFEYEEKFQIAQGAAEGTFKDLDNYLWSVNAQPRSTAAGEMLSAVSLTVARKNLSVKRDGEYAWTYGVDTYLRDQASQVR